MFGPTLLAVAVGCLLAVQGVLNARVGAFLGRPIHAAILSFVVGLVALVLFATASGDGLPPAARLRALPPPFWTAGLLGAVYVASVILLVPRIGSATLIAASVAGQLAMALALDHFGAIGLATRPLDAWRVFGVLLLGAGVFFIQKK